MKKCFKCGIDKPLDMFYKHKQMSDGLLNKCKECCKSQSKQRHHEKYKDPLFVESERERARDKYKRLNYKEKQKVWDENRPWKKSQIYKNLSRDLNIKKGFEFHHWNYNLDFLKDGFIMDVKSHRNLHTNLIFLEDERIFKTNNGIVLDTKKKHLDFIKSLGFSCEVV